MRHLLISVACWAVSLGALAQCGSCVINDTCTVSPPFPRVCPAIPPPATVGVPYSVNATFWIPPSFPEPTTQLNVVLQQVTLISLENLPLGLTYQASSPDLTFYPQTQPFGCVRICGTPMVASSDSVRLTALAQGTAGGIPISRNYTFALAIEVLPAAQDTVPDFGFTPDSLCSPVAVAFTEAEGAPGMSTAFNWSFGNGNSHNGAAPPEQTYLSGGTYPITLQRSFSVPMITQISISGVSNAWCGDLDEPNLPIVGCVGQPDLYVTVTDARLVMRKTTVVNNVQSTTWNGLSFPLGFPPYTIRVFDKDDLSADDLLGTFVVAGNLGSTPFSQGGTAGQIQVQVQTVLTTTYSTLLTVFDTPMLTLDLTSGLDEVCATPADLANYAWTLDGIEVGTTAGPCLPAANGLWEVVGSSAQGCIGSATRLVSGVGIPDHGERPRARFYPNPTSGPLQVVVPASGPAAFTVYDVSGRIVLQRSGVMPGQAGTYPLQVGALGEGQYLLCCETDGHRSCGTLSVLPR